MAPSRHDWKIVDWDVKPQHNQPNLPVNLSAKRGAASTIFNDFGMSRPGIEPVTSRSPERTLYQLSYRGRSDGMLEDTNSLDGAHMMHGYNVYCNIQSFYRRFLIQ